MQSPTSLTLTEIGSSCRDAARRSCVLRLRPSHSLTHTHTHTHTHSLTHTHTHTHSLSPSLSLSLSLSRIHTGQLVPRRRAKVVRAQPATQSSQA